MCVAKYSLDADKNGRVLQVDLFVHCSPPDGKKRSPYQVILEENLCVVPYHYRENGGNLVLICSFCANIYGYFTPKQATIYRVGMRGLRLTSSRGILAAELLLYNPNSINKK
jgi:hypothetical protein